MANSVQQIITAAKAEAAKMQSAIANSGGAGQVAMSVDQFSSLAKLIRAMSDMLAQPDPGSFGEARYWVPLEVFERNRKALKSLEKEFAELRVARQSEQILSSWS